MRAFERPRPLIPPPVGTHDEEPDGGLVHDPVVPALEVVVEPAQDRVVELDERLLAVVDAPQLARAVGPMGPGADEHLLAARRLRRCVRHHGRIVGRRAREHEIEAPGDVKGGDANLAHQRRIVDLLPILVESLVGHPVFPPRQAPARAFIDFADGQLPEDLRPVVRGVVKGR